MSEAFTQQFRAEHRQVRDALFELSDAFGAHDASRAASLLGSIAGLTGPHFRYEEETMYPSLVQIFGPDYISALIDDHDGVIAGARRLVELAGGTIDDEVASEAKTIVQGMLPHVSDCDGLSIMVERLQDDEVQAIFDTRDRALADGIDLLTWDSTIRSRPALVA